MCGIVGFFSKNGIISQEALKRATQVLSHRGPDGQNFWIAPHQRVGLGHTRLSIIDLTTGAQPISNEQENLHIVVNGEFYDFERIQDDLKRRGYRLRTHSDSEIALHLYDEFGTQCLQHLRGEFAFVLWDERNDLLFAARDRFGIKPLYYTVIGDTLYLASEVKALFTAGVPAQWDWESVFQDNYGVMLQDRTLYQGIYQVPPGYFLIANRSNIQLIRYWDFNYPTDNVRPQYTEEEYIEKLRYELNEAIRLRLRADVPVGCYLSGGLDSSTILGMMAAQMSQPIQTFTAIFDHPAYSEEAIVRETAALTGANLNLVMMSQAELADNFSDAIWHGETTIDNASSVSKFVLSKAVRDFGYKVVLTGEGSDEIFAGYFDLRRDMLFYNTQGQDENTVQQLLAQLRDSNLVASGYMVSQERPMQLASVKRSLGFVPTWFETWAEIGMKIRSLYSSDFTTQIANRDAYRICLNQIDVQGQLTGREPVHQSLYLRSKTELPHLLLMMYGDKVDMAHSVESRYPFFDHHVVELVCQMPVSLKIRGMTEKYVLREAAKPFLTNTVYRRHKHPYVAPPPSLKPNESFNELMQDTMRGSIMASLPFYDQAKVVALLDKLPFMNDSQRIVIDIFLMKLLSACFLHERFRLSVG
ncbi:MULTISPECIES: asparagine synthase (glutamine-hydrolyzing) [Nostocales]|jgi:asparagine synthase (glutamine-hydrolysing)|uniref:Asparagine synthase (Glutamine-hydrolyzing) n=1 Tax=Dolichospermum flos-aquae UHCC 0037 TaxID=2590026 RepID=A0ACC7SAY8_DOLFA|nr:MULTISPECIES: asparagine synthase (glutamine-hydrolyzing) [Nostocales]MBO1066168.1 asparagine synthase (glutamine-hydrolyzing) [Anabaena sp. 54]MTJ45356.1 asparagine synthase (glutamine-hydrolyzing) [Dolichospermum flos-aquae UHCC 0037]OBQ20470.1 MAG: asparagine synthase [Anabaena sp. AL93]